MISHLLTNILSEVDFIHTVLAGTMSFLKNTNSFGPKRAIWLFGAFRDAEITNYPSSQWA